MARFIDGVSSGIRREIDAGNIPDHLDPAETATALLMLNERYLMDRFGRLPRHDPATAVTLRQIWTRTLCGD